MLSDTQARSGQQRGSPSGSVSFVIPDPHIVYYDAVSQSSWDHDGEGSLPQRGDWSTYRYTVKDLILAIATHRYNKNNRRLEIRAYFTGEHPMFKELEASKAMLIVFCCQAYQSGGSMELLFESGVPFDIRELIERATGIAVSGHQQLLDADLARQAFSAVSSFTEEEQRRIAAEGIPVEMVCYNTFRGTWTPGHIKSLLNRGVPLRWLFRQRPSAVRRAMPYAHLLGHIRAVLLEEYALRRLEDRPMGESLGRRINREDRGGLTRYSSPSAIRLEEDGGPIAIPADAPFCLLPMQAGPARATVDSLQEHVAGARRWAADAQLLVVLPMDFAYFEREDREALLEAVQRCGAQALVVGVTWTQLLTEAEYLLAVTAAEADEDEIEAVNVDRFPD